MATLKDLLLSKETRILKRFSDATGIEVKLETEVRHLTVEQLKTISLSFVNEKTSARSKPGSVFAAEALVELTNRAHRLKIDIY